MLGIHLGIECKSHFLKSFSVQKMCFVYYHANVSAMDLADESKLFMQLPLGIAPIEFCLDSKLIQEAFVEPSRRELRIGKVKDGELLRA